LGAKAEKGFKFVKMSLEKYWRKEIKKKKKGVSAAGPTRLPFGPAKPRGPVSPSPLPRADARQAPPGAGHVAAVCRRRGRAARPTGLPRSGRHPAPQDAILSPPAPSPFSARERSRISSNRRGAIASQSSAARRRPC